MALFDRMFHYSKLLGAKGVAGSILGKLSGSPAALRFGCAGVAHPMHLRLPSSDADAYDQVFVQRQYELEVRRPPTVIVDAGANIGLASIWFANRFPDARIIAIECERSNFDLLQRNVEKYPNVSAVHAALWNHDGEISIVDPGLGKWGFMTRESSTSTAATGSVRARRLDSLLAEFGLDHVDILKLDIEGAELEVMRDATAWIDKVDTVIAELHDRLKPGCESTFALATTSFPQRWHQGENSCVSRPRACVVRPTEVPG